MGGLRSFLRTTSRLATHLTRLRFWMGVLAVVDKVAPFSSFFQHAEPRGFASIGEEERARLHSRATSGPPAW